MAMYLTCGCGTVMKNSVINCKRQFSIGIKAWSATATQKSSTLKLDQKQIVIPNKKRRDELSILQAIASTVKKDFNAPHFKYIDDPYLIPASSLEKRSYSLAKAAGQKAAKYVLNSHPALFRDNPAEPTVEALMPPSGFLHPEDTEMGMKERIDRRMCSPAFQSYRCLKDKGSTVDEGLLNSLLDLLCMYNSNDPAGDLTSDEQFYKRDIGQDNTKKISKTWNDQGAAEELFSDLGDNNVRAYCSMIRGRSKYFQVDKAFDLFTEMREKAMKPDLQTYNAILRVASFRSEQPEKRWDYLKDILAVMVEDKIHPNLTSFNNVLYTLTRSSRSRDCPQWVLQTINEMKRLEIEPSLSSWLYVLQVFYASPENQSPILYDIMKELEDTDLVLHEESDLEFFSIAMVKCFVNIKDMELAYKIDNLLNHGNNMRFVGDGFKEGLYYTHFLRLLCMLEEIDTIMEHYNRISPNVYTPSFTALDDLLRAIELNDGYKYLPKIWSDFVLFDYTRRTDLIEPLLALMAKKRQDDQTQDIFVKISQQLKKKWEEDSQNSFLMRPLQFSAPMVSSLAMVNLNSGNFVQAWDFFEIYLHNKQNTTGFISEDCLVKFADCCLESQDLEKLMGPSLEVRRLQMVPVLKGISSIFFFTDIMKTMADFAYPKFDVIAAKVKAEMNLNPEQCNAIEDLV